MNNYLFFLISCVILFSFALKLNYGWLVNTDYQSSVNYIYLLAISAMFFSLSAFFDMGYQCSKKTIYTLPGIIIASLVNVVGNYFLIQSFGVYGIIVSSILTFGTLFIYRAFDTRKFFKIKFKTNSTLHVIFLIISGIAFYTIKNTVIDIVYIITITCLLYILAPQNIKNYIKNKLFRNNNHININ